MSSSPGAGPSTPTLIDPYRPMKKSIRNAINAFLPPHHLSASAEPPSLASLLNLDTQTYATRLSGKLFQLHSFPSAASHPPGSSQTSPAAPSPALAQTTGPSPLVVGRKRNRGDPSALAVAQAEHAQAARRRADLGIQGARKEKQRAGGIVKRGMTVSYAALLPLHYMHCHYLSQLLALPPLPFLAPSTSSGSVSSLPSHISPDAVNGKLIKADFTGIHLTVAASRNTSVIGLAGIAIEETASTFALVPPDSRVRIVPKDGTQFRLSIPAYAAPTPVERADGEPADPVDMQAHLEVCPRIEVLLLGTAFGYRSGERAGRKFRPAQGADGSGWGLEWVEGEWSRVLRPLEDVLGKTEPGTPSKRKRRTKEKNRKKDGPIENWLDVVY